MFYIYKDMATPTSSIRKHRRRIDVICKLIDATCVRIDSNLGILANKIKEELTIDFNEWIQQTDSLFFTTKESGRKDESKDRTEEQTVLYNRIREIYHRQTKDVFDSL